jgi:hypothetical protein
MPIHDVIPLYPGGNSEHSGDPILRLPGGPLSCYQIQRQITRLQAGFLSSGIYRVFFALGICPFKHLPNLAWHKKCSFNHLPILASCYGTFLQLPILAAAMWLHLQTPAKPCVNSTIDPSNTYQTLHGELRETFKHLPNLASIGNLHLQTPTEPCAR